MKPYKNMGFTLIELLVVVLIIGILAAVALPKYTVAVGRARVARALPVLHSIALAQQRHYMAAGEYTADFETLDISLPYKTRSGNTYHGTPIGNVSLSADMVGVYWSGDDLTIDIYENHQLCYPHARAAGKTGEKICATLGPKRGTTSSVGTTVYTIQF